MIFEPWLGAAASFLRVPRISSRDVAGGMHFDKHGAFHPSRLHTDLILGSRADCYARQMVRLSVMYPASAGSQFNWDYYLGPHRELARRLLSSRGLVRTEVDRGIGGIPPGGPPPYHAIGHLFFHSMADLLSALEATVSELVADERNYSSVPSVVQISEILE